MKLIRRLLLGTVILIIMVFLFRGFIYRQLISYQSIGERTSYPASNNELIEYLEKNAATKQEDDVEAIIEEALRLTSRQLDFSISNTQNDPNKLIRTKKAHCVGYAAFCAATCNYLLKKQELNTSWEAKPQIGHLYLLGSNIHRYFNSSFFKDHDFVIIENKQSGEKYAVDPSVHDYLKINFVRLKTK